MLVIIHKGYDPGVLGEARKSQGVRGAVMLSQEVHK